MKRKILVFLGAFTVFFFIRCSGEQPKNEINNKTNDNVVPAQLITPKNDQQFVSGNRLEIEIKVNKPESVRELELFINDTLYQGNLKVENQTINVETKLAQVGKTKIFLSYKDEQGKLRGDNRQVIIFSDVIPENEKATIVNTYPHAKTSYTQGLEFYNGKFFEGTGQYNQSILTEVDLQSGTKLREHELDGAIFGEGITILNDTIYQLTYRAQICYRYDMDFNQIGTFNYDGEGWGLCNNGKQLIMSNGSDEVVWRNPRTFEIEKTINIFDHQTNVMQINELELIDGALYANLYTDNRIVKIDTATGKVLSYIDFSAIVNDANEPGNDVLNGIAYNPDTEKIYATGKWWSKLYEISFGDE